jgi:hypothetical protein
MRTRMISRPYKWIWIGRVLLSVSLVLYRVQSSNNI